MLQILLAYFYAIFTFSCVHILWINCTRTDLRFSHNIYTHEK